MLHTSLPKRFCAFHHPNLSFLLSIHWHWDVSWASRFPCTLYLSSAGKYGVEYGRALLIRTKEKGTTILPLIERMYDAGLPQGRRQIARLTLADNEVTVENSKYMPVPATCVWTGGRVLEGNEVAIARMSEPCVQIWTWQHKRAEEVAAPHKICVWNLVVHSSPVTEHMSLKVGALPI